MLDFYKGQKKIMNKALFAFMLITFSFGALAQELTCLNKLLPYNRFSGHHQITRNEWNDNNEALNEESARVAFTFLVNSKLMCKTNEITIKVDPVCSSVIADIPQSKTCFVFTNLGFFVISRDNGRNLNFIFSKDKQFSDAL